MNLETELGIHDRDAEIERLRRRRNAIIEECVSVAAWYAARGYTPSEIIKAIAALKDKQ